jgi:hypothetical protein
LIEEILLVVLEFRRRSVECGLGELRCKGSEAVVFVRPIVDIQKAGGVPDSLLYFPIVVESSL